MPKTTSPFEQAARARKVARLVRHVTELVRYLGLTPEADGYLISELVRAWGDAEWAQACVNVGSNKASVETRLQVIGYFVAKARKAS